MTLPLAPDVMLALIGFSFVTSITPGPSNLILLSSGVTFGFRRSLPLAFGVSFGFLSMLLLVGLGVGQLLQANPTVYGLLRLACLGYVLWLAWKIATSRPPSGESGQASGSPVSFLQAALLQWVNPKAWAVALIATVTYTATRDYALSLLLMILLFALVNLPSISTWALFGVALRRILRDPARVRAFNLAMALLLVASMAPLFIELVG